MSIPLSSHNCDGKYIYISHIYGGFHKWGESQNALFITENLEIKWMLVGGLVAIFYIFPDILGV